MRRKTCGTLSKLQKAQYQVSSLSADRSLFRAIFQKFFIVGDPATALITTSMLLVEDPCTSVEQSAGSGTVFITRHTWFNRLKAKLSSG